MAQRPTGVVDGALPESIGKIQAKSDDNPSTLNIVENHIKVDFLLYLG